MTQLYSPIETIELEIVRKGELFDCLRAMVLSGVTLNASPEWFAALEGVAVNFGMTLNAPSMLVLPERTEVSK